MTVQESPCKIALIQYRIFYNTIERGLFMEEVAEAEVERNGIDNLNKMCSGLFYTTKSNLDICELIFNMTNDKYGRDSNPLDDPALQKKIRSMSTGDLVEIKRDDIYRYYLCANIGWKEIKIDR